MKGPTTSRGVFFEAACIALIAEGTRWVSGVYDQLSASKLIGVLLIAVLSAIVAGYRAQSALHTEPTVVDGQRVTPPPVEDHEPKNGT